MKTLRPGSAVALLALLTVCPLVGCGESATAAKGAKVTGTLTLPAAAAGKPYLVRVLVTPGLAFVAETSGTTPAGNTLPYSISGVPAGTYFMLGSVDVDNSGGDASTPGDHAGWYGHSGDGNPPPAASVVVPASGTVTVDWALVLR